MFVVYKAFQNIIFFLIAFEKRMTFCVFFFYNLSSMFFSIIETRQNQRQNDIFLDNFDRQINECRL